MFDTIFSDHYRICVTLVHYYFLRLRHKQTLVVLLYWCDSWGMQWRVYHVTFLPCRKCFRVGSTPLNTCAGQA